jgi:hypothetical protein
MISTSMTAAGCQAEALNIEDEARPLLAASIAALSAWQAYNYNSTRFLLEDSSNKLEIASLSTARG